ncbi:hypothetical protein [Pseudoalteromonas luteoviolacea]|uniref:ParB/Sulfiredoxin domain-containing protein n=1 Tax=Pseudoalteromonas luteoviolacea NCIMB 1942 TaxID=1365253 RepID=A0A166XTC6_9GAMM|nr:hypothetical protein [Pseudoalteromonas luteoviolacea]KZN40893.1 hypothetical protein N482_21000 [Pseudoalteromonas luteoviolacea NCIMB 1942]
MIDKTNDLILATLNNAEQVHSETFEYTSLFLNSIVPDESNARFFPSVFIENKYARQFSERKLTKLQLTELLEAEGKVILGKDCIINCLEHGSNEWKKANKTIESIIELGENISVSEMIQVPTVYPVNQGQYRILTGHRRFFALLFSFGYEHAAQFKVYDSKPLLYKVKQFQENASREDLPQYGKLQAFLSAILEIDGLDQARVKVGQRPLTVKEKAKNLGISMGSYDNYNVLTRYAEVIKFYENGLNASFLKVKKVILDCEAKYKEAHGKKQLNIADKKLVGENILACLSGHKVSVTKKDASYKIKDIPNLQALKAILFNDVSKLELNIDWKKLDWNNRDAVNRRLVVLVDLLK